jgi:Domain of unknown function (DUF4411)
MPRNPDLFPKTVYCIDTSSLINLKPFRRDVFPTIWSKLEDMIHTAELIAPLEVYGEIEIGKDKIYDWCKSNKGMFKDVDDCQIQTLHEIRIKYDKNYWENEINKPKWADPWVIALCICEEAIIVADEKNTKNRIPAISSMFKLRCLELIDFLKEIGIKY